MMGGGLLSRNTTSNTRTITHISHDHLNTGFYSTGRFYFSITLFPPLFMWVWIFIFILNHYTLFDVFWAYARAS